MMAEVGTVEVGLGNKVKTQVLSAAVLSCRRQAKRILAVSVVEPRHAHELNRSEGSKPASEVPLTVSSTLRRVFLALLGSNKPA